MNFLKKLFYTTEEVEVIKVEEESIELQDMFDIEVANNHNYFANDVLVSNCRNPKAQRTKIINDIIKQLKPLKIWLLTGTPIDNRPSDYYNLLKIIKHPVAKNWITYITRYCDGYQNGFGQWETKGASNMEELHKLTKDVFLRRLKKTSGISMPDKIRRPIFLELKNKKGYNQVIEDYKKGRYDKLVDELDFKGELEDVGVEEITQLLLHRQFCALEKIEDGSLIDLVDNIMDEDPDNKIIIFTNFRKVIDAVYIHYGESVCRFVDGRILDPKKRLEIVDEFNANNDLKILVCNLKVGSTGLNIQSANKVIVNDMDWVPSNMLQAEDRAWRIGQKRDVEAIYPIYDNTVEEILYQTIEKKIEIISTIVEGKSETYFEDSILPDNKEARMNERKSLIKEILAQIGL